jgi:hypothetical protein
LGLALARAGAPLMLARGGEISPPCGYFAEIAAQGAIGE